MEIKIIIQITVLCWNQTDWRLDNFTARLKMFHETLYMQPWTMLGNAWLGRLFLDWQEMADIKWGIT